ncbi:hypothetical protein EAF04_002512 [Stromatinia cepivora]|nr:hypothetical protein EAF04_002512 [Stromatinia cepivora]
MSCYFCHYTNLTYDKKCLGCEAVLPGHDVKERVTIVYGDDNCEAPSVVRDVQKPQRNDEGDRIKPSCMAVQIEFCDVKCLIVLGRKGEKEPVRMSAARKVVSSNLKDEIKSVELELPL